jgi:hypothetical protein
MSLQRKSAKALAVSGCAVLLAGAAFQLLGAYPGISRGAMASNLSRELQSTFRTVFLLAGWHWIAMAVIALIAALSGTGISRAILLICGIALLADAGVMLRFLGWFVGTDTILVSAALILSGGLLSGPARESA